ncbi:MAG: hypothetical protein E7313_05030 [Clostridiales bacterium]|nr:hypothetical protein [Clostridiales bacterium]
MNEDMSNIVGNLSQMLNNQDIPDNIKNILNSLNSNKDNNDSQHNSNTNFTNNTNNNNTSYNQNTDTSNPFENIDFNTIFKIKNIMNSINNSQTNDSRTNLLLALKPYLKETRKNKIDTYIKLINMGKILENLDLSGGDTNNV